MNARKELAARVRGVLRDPAFSEKMWSSVARARGHRAKAMSEFAIDVRRMKEENRSVKVSSAADGTLVGRFAEQVAKNGGRVFLARTGADAVGYVAEVARRVGATALIKSKSITSEEIDLNRGLEREGIRCIETDLGELLVQLAGERPIHLVAPAAHMSVADIADTVNRKLGLDVPPEHDAILKAVREYLRPIFLSNSVGLTGANVGIAETGTVVMETNEGNGRLVSAAPDVHVVLIGREKIVASWADAAKLVAGHAMSASGQRMTVYVSAVTQRPPLGGREREFHVVILDNGRSRMLQDERYRDALNCIRCGACMNVCPTYGVVGGHVFGHIYPGPIGIPWTANVHGLENATFSHLCISCGLCKDVCPVDIDVPMMIARVKQEEVALRGQPRANRFFASSEGVARLASATAPLSNWVSANRASRYLMEKVFGVDRRRTLPTFARRRLRARLRGVPDGDGSAGKVVFFPDVYADCNDPELGVAAVGALRSLGYSVALPELRWSGMPYVSYGELARAKRTAEHNLKVLEPYVREGYDVVATEPTPVYMLKGAYTEMVPGEPAREVARHSFTFFELIEGRIDGLELERTFAADGEVGFHVPCHDRGLAAGRPAVRFLERAGYRVRLVETGTCCGMGGTFGMKQGALGYDLSMAVGQRLFELFRQSGCRLVATESSVCSTQISDGTGIPVVHPLRMARFA